MKNIMRHIIVALFMLVTSFVYLPIQKARADLCCTCAETTEEYLKELFLEGMSEFFYNDPTLDKMTRHMEGEFTTHKQWIAGVMWEDNILPAMMMMTDELVDVGLKQMEAIGMLFDAKIQMETQQVMQVEEAKIHKIYTPSMGMCEIGTNVKSLATTDRRSEINQRVLSQRSIGRNLGQPSMSGFINERQDNNSRLTQFKNHYCEEGGNRKGMEPLCGNLKQDTIVDRNANRRNRDIDYVRLIDTPWTINLNLTDTHLSHYEEDTFALAANLYGHKIPRRPSAESLTDNNGVSDTVPNMQKAYMDFRSLMAKRSVAENSFSAIAGMKSSGTPGSREYMMNIMAGLGVAVDESVVPINFKKNEASILLNGDDGKDWDTANPLWRPNPSYYAQMEILTKKMLQNPDFYTNLYDKPTNVDRKTVSLQAIGLMQKFDIFKSYLRQEAAISVLLEMAVTSLQNEIENDLQSSP